MPNERDEDLARAHYAKKYKDLKELDAYANKTIEDVSKTRDDLQNGNHPDLAINVPHTVAQGFSKLGFNTFATVADFFSNFGGPSHTTKAQVDRLDKVKGELKDEKRDIEHRLKDAKADYQAVVPPEQLKTENRDSKTRGFLSSFFKGSSTEDSKVGVCTQVGRMIEKEPGFTAVYHRSDRGPSGRGTP